MAIHAFLMATAMILSPAASSVGVVVQGEDRIIMRRTIMTPMGIPKAGGQPPAPTPVDEPVEVAGWSYTQWSTPSDDACGPVSVTREVSCRTRKGPVADSLCSATPHEDLRKQVVVASGCTGTWTPGSWSEWSDACSASSTRSRTVSCTATGYPLIDLDPSMCRDTQPNLSEGAQITSGCAYVSWVPDEWSAWSAQCGNATRSRTVTCVAKRTDGSTFRASDAACPIDRPASSETKLQSNCSSVVGNSNFETGRIGPWTGTGISQNTMEGTTNWGTEGVYTGKLLEGQSLSQNMTSMVPGGRYRISFVMRPTAVTATSVLTVVAGDARQTYTRTSSNVTWQPRSIDFTASSSTSISFQASQGIFYFDVVVVTPL